MSFLVTVVQEPGTLRPRVPSEDEFDAALHVHVHVQSKSSVGAKPRGAVRDRPAAFFWRDPQHASPAP